MSHICPTVKDINPINDVKNPFFLYYILTYFLFLYTINNKRITVTHNEHQNVSGANHPLFFHV